MSVVRFRMRAASVIVALLCSACGTAEAVVETPRAAPPVPLPETSVPVPTVPPPVPLPDVSPAPPAAPAPAPRGSIRAQSVYPALDVTEWTLPNGVVVVYKQVRETEGYLLRAFARGGWSSLPPRDSIEAQQWLPQRWEEGDLSATLTAHERRIDARGEDIEALLASVPRVFQGDLPPARVPATAVSALDPEVRVGRAESVGAGSVSLRSVFADPGAFTVVVVGAGDPDLAASAAGRFLTPLRAAPDEPRTGRTTGTAASSGPAGSEDAHSVDLAFRISSRAGDETPLQVLRGALEASLDGSELGRVEVTSAREPWTETAWLRVLVVGSGRDAESVERAVREALSGDALYVARARRQLSRELGSPTALHWLDAVTQLYREGGGRQPGHDPASLSPLNAPLSRVTDSDVLTLARRFAVSTDMAVLPTP